MKIARSFSYMFKDSSWFFKVFIGGIYLIIGLTVIGFAFVLGYEVEHIRRMVATSDENLPDWKYPGRLFREGANVLIATAVYAWLVFGAGWASGAAATTGRFIAIFVLLLFLWTPLLLVQYAKRPALFSCFALGEITASVVRRPVSFAAGLTVSTGVILATISLGWMSLIVGWPFVIFWGIAVQSHILGQLARI